MVVNDQFGEIENVKPRNLPSKVVIVPRSHWKAAEPSEKIPPLPPSVSKIVFTWTDTDPCLISFECEPLMKKLQTEHMEKGMADIQYNFLVGSNKVIYEGRGWKAQPHPYPDTIENAHEFNGKCIEIAFVEKHMKEPEVDMVNTMARFLALMMIEKKVVEEPGKTITMVGLKDNKFVKFSELMEDDSTRALYPPDPDRWKDPWGVLS